MDLSDAEYRLFDVLIHIVDWDKDHETFGTTSESLRDIKEHYLPHHAIGKLSETITSLAKRDFLKRLRDRIEVNNFKWLISKSVQDGERFNGLVDEPTVHHDERLVQVTEQKIQPGEHDVHASEHGDKKGVGEARHVMPMNIGENEVTVHPDETQKTSKEHLEKLKEHQTNEENLLMIQKLKNEYGPDIEVPIRNFSLLLVRDAARRMEARIRRGEPVKNRVGYITKLCKEGIAWDLSEEKADEDRAGARAVAQEEEQRKLMEEHDRPMTPEEKARREETLRSFREMRNKIGRNNAPPPQNR